MSQFKTTLNVDIDALMQSAPRGTFIHSATLSEDKKTVVVVWDNPRFVSLTCEGKEFTVEQLKGGQLPDQVVWADWAKPNQTVKVEDKQSSEQPETVGVATPAKRKK